MPFTDCCLYVLIVNVSQMAPLRRPQAMQRCGESLLVFCENLLKRLLVVVMCEQPATTRRVWWVWFEIAIVLADLIVELPADVALARLKGQSVYLYPLTCNLSLTGLTKPRASSCCATKTHWKLEPLEIPVFTQLPPHAYWNKMWQTVSQPTRKCAAIFLCTGLFHRLT